MALMMNYRILLVFPPKRVTPLIDTPLWGTHKCRRRFWFQPPTGTLEKCQVNTPKKAAHDGTLDMWRVLDNRTQATGALD